MSDEDMSESEGVEDQSDPPGEEQRNGERAPRAEPGESGWELWSRCAVVFFIFMAACWILVVLPLGLFSVKVHATAIPILGTLTVPMMFWGLIRTLFRPPVVRRSRMIAFGLLLVVGVLGNVPLFPPPLETSDWSPPAPYSLPFEGTWYTTAGGDDMSSNYHATTAAYRWAYDFTVVKDESKYRDDGSVNSDYYCWGRDVLAPIDAEVVDYHDGEVDNTPGEPAQESVFGNHVVLKVRDEEYVFLAHMKKDSVAVRPGDNVEAGDKVGQCGNSGRSVEPHLHIHAQTTKNFPYAQSLPLVFSGYVANGEAVESGMPRGGTEWEKLDGDFVENTD